MFINWEQRVCLFYHVNVLQYTVYCIVYCTVYIVCCVFYTLHTVNYIMFTLYTVDIKLLSVFYNFPFYSSYNTYYKSFPQFSFYLPCNLEAGHDILAIQLVLGELPLRSWNNCLQCLQANTGLYLQTDGRKLLPYLQDFCHCVNAGRKECNAPWQLCTAPEYSSYHNMRELQGTWLPALFFREQYCSIEKHYPAFVSPF